jgi:hypothetical protein
LGSRPLRYVCLNSVEDRNKERVKAGKSKDQLLGTDASPGAGPVVLQDTGFTSSVTGRGKPGEQLDEESLRRLNGMQDKDAVIDQVVGWHIL